MTKSLHERRKVTFRELGALYAVRGMIADGAMTHCAGAYPCNEHIINMSISYGKNGDCGTVSCIGGTMALIMGLDDPGWYVARTNRAYDIFDTMLGGGARRSNSLGGLFFPPIEGPIYYKITAKQMLAAIDNWLATGRAGWKKILATK